VSVEPCHEAGKHALGFLVWRRLPCDAFVLLADDGSSVSVGFVDRCSKPLGIRHFVSADDRLHLPVMSAPA